eukprot:357307-Chlamydomonas_euryale.AAC.4
MPTDLCRPPIPSRPALTHLLPDGSSVVSCSRMLPIATATCIVAQSPISAITVLALSEKSCAEGAGSPAPSAATPASMPAGAPSPAGIPSAD